MNTEQGAALLTGWAKRLGLPGWVGLVLLAAAAYGAALSLPQLQRDTADLRSQADALRRGARSGTPAQTPDQPRALLAALIARLAPPGSQVRSLEVLLKQAHQHGLMVDAVRFRAQPGGLPGVIRHEVSLPVRGRYVGLRAWLADALAKQPALSLDALQIKRADAQDDTIEARVTLSLWVQDAPAPAQSQSQSQSQSAAPILKQQAASGRAASGRAASGVSL